MNIFFTKHDMIKKQVFKLILVFLITTSCYAQREVYDSLIQKANQYFSVKDYKNAAEQYSNAFISLGGKGIQEDRYKAALAWSLVGNNDSAFFNLFRLAYKTKYLDLAMLSTEPRLKSLQVDKRWQELLLIVNPNKEIYNDSLAKILSKVFDDDQKYRTQFEYIEDKYGEASIEMKQLALALLRQDSINRIIITEIIDKYGWLSRNEVGEKGNLALWAVIQHSDSDIKTQEKYFTVMQKAVKEGKARRQDLAYLEDRILVNQGKKQLYGTQFNLDKETKEIKPKDVEDPENLNKRRESVGLPPL